jgi:Dna[CI] antecedent, DciA
MDEIFAALPALLKEHSGSEEVRRAVAFAVWRKVAGEHLSEHTSPVDLEDDRLVIAVADRSWQRNLEALASEMLFRLNSKIGRKLVGFIEFRIDKDAALAGRKTDERRADFEMEALDEINETLRRAADKISDDVMRRKFLLAAGSCLARERRIAESE